ncbi:MAG: hypothetical protein AAF682_22835 [Planctomycetota bacterium]
MKSTLVLAFLLALPQDTPDPAPASPPPDRYDDQHDALLFRAWGGTESPGSDSAAGPREPRLERQPAPLRPRDWIVFDAPAGTDGDPFVLQHIVHQEPFPEADEAQRATMPERAPLAGGFSHARTHLDSEVDEVRFLRAPGASAVFVNGEPFVGDPDRRGWLGVPVSLRTGRNTLVVAGVRGGFELELWKPVTRTVIASWAVQAPGGERRLRPLDLLHVPVFNAAIAPADGIHFHYGDAATAGELSRIDEWSDGGFAPPLAIVPRSLPLLGAPLSSDPEVRLPVAAFHGADRHADRRLLSLAATGPRPRWPVAQARAWPAVPQGSSRGALVVEGGGELHLEALAAARYFQQRLWERGGELLPLLSQARLEAGESHLQNRDWIVRFGRLDGGEPGLLWAGPEPAAEGSPATFALRASDPLGMRLSYVIDPFFRGLDAGGESWSAR